MLEKREVGGEIDAENREVDGELAQIGLRTGEGGSPKLSEVDGCGSTPL